jgi:hypothetical protein
MKCASLFDCLTDNLNCYLSLYWSMFIISVPTDGPFIVRTANAETVCIYLYIYIYIYIYIYAPASSNWNRKIESNRSYVT